MDERERAERFNRELDSLLEGGSAGPELPGAARRLGKADFSKESRIKESLRRRLLERQAQGGLSPLEGLLAGWLRPMPARLAAAAALLVLVAVFPLRQFLRPVPRPLPTPPQVVRPAAPAVQPPVAAQPKQPESRPAKRRAPGASYAPGAAGSGRVPAGLDDSEIWNKPVTAEDLIERVPADRIFERRSAKGLLGSVAGTPLRSVPSKGLLRKVSASPKSPIPAQPVFSTVKARKVAGKDRTQIVWETEDSTFILEQRTTSLEELFEKGAL